MTPTNGIALSLGVVGVSAVSRSKGSLLLTPQDRADLLTVGFPLPLLSETPETREGGDHPVSFEDDPSASEARGGSVKPNSRLVYIGMYRLQSVWSGFMRLGSMNLGIWSRKGPRLRPA